MISPEVERSDAEIREAWRQAHVKPLWEIEASHKPGGQTAHTGVWKWSVMEPLVEEALKLTNPAIVERRVLSMIDPTAREGDFQTTTNLNAALQILLPGEAARPHRHSANALRFVLRGSGAITRVDGKEAPMLEGDLVITPGWAWHEHWHAGTEPIVWLDVLDVHAHMHLGTFAFEPGPVHDVPTLPPEAAFASANVVPDLIATTSSPVFRYPLADAEAALKATPAQRDGSRRVRYVNPLNGGPVMPFLDCYLVELDPGTTTAAFRTSANAVCTIVRGSGSTTIDGHAVGWERRDVFTLPHGVTYAHHADERTLLFVCTDREIYRRLGLLTEDYPQA